MKTAIKVEKNEISIIMKKIEKNKAASWCCEASTIVDIRKMIEAIKTQSLDKNRK